MNELTRIIDRKIQDLLNEKNQINEAIFKEASKNWLSLLNAEYESSSTRTPQYLTFCRVFKKQFSKLLKDSFDIKKIEIFKPNHFDAGGFFEVQNGKIFYFSVGDLRWNKDFLIRSAMDFKDYTGGTNKYCDIDKGIDIFTIQLKNIVLGYN